MTEQKEINGILDFLICPGFCVKDHIITQVNPAAAAMLLAPGTDIRSLLLTGAEEYKNFHSGCMYLTLSIGEKGCGSAVIRKDGADYFLLDQSQQDAVLCALSLAARELRSAMTGAMLSGDQLSRHIDPLDGEAAEVVARLNRGLHRTLRLIGNMSDASGWPYGSRQEICNIGNLMAEIFEKAQTFSHSLGVSLHYTPLAETVYTLLDAAQLERAVLNLLSNTLKFTPAGGTVHASLSLHGRMLRLSIADSGSGIPENILSNIFNRYLRQPGLEDSRYGLGLGMTFVRNAAAAHGGTVLIDQPEGKGTRITMTLAIRQDTPSLRSPILGLDYAGERDHALLELSDCLPLDLYR